VLATDVMPGNEVHGHDLLDSNLAGKTWVWGESEDLVGLTRDPSVAGQERQLREQTLLGPLRAAKQRFELRHGVSCLLAPQSNRVYDEDLSRSRFNVDVAECGDEQWAKSQARELRPERERCGHLSFGW